jgi:hypothetical protein
MNTIPSGAGPGALIALTRGGADWTTGDGEGGSAGGAAALVHAMANAATTTGANVLTRPIPATLSQPDDRVNEDYSYRSARWGSIRVTRCTGTQAAARAAAVIRSPIVT